MWKKLRLGWNCRAIRLLKTVFLADQNDIEVNWQKSVGWFLKLILIVCIIKVINLVHNASYPDVFWSILSPGLIPNSFDC